MKVLLCILALCLTYASAASISSLADSRIAGGKPVNIQDCPYQVSILIKNEQEETFEPFCGGSIYSDRIVLTAAHCIARHDVSSIHVAAGSKYDKGKGGVIVSVKDKIIHENFKYDIADNDIAIIILSAPLPLNNQTMKAIPLVEHGPIQGEIGTVAGWGLMSNGGDFSEVLRAVQVPIVGQNDCIKDYNNIGKIITNSMFCAGYQGVGGKDSCNGDSGAPLIVDGKLAGISSWAQGCALPDFPSVYSNVFYLRSWILQKIANYH